MRLNEHTVITGNLVLLVPYEEHHVPKYHEWMKSEELQSLTASEPLTLDEEYNMQKSWRIDPDKCTFIVLNREAYEKCRNEVQAMVGDTNFFLRQNDGKNVAEVEIMIADNEARGKGLGKEALLLMLRYGIENLKLDIIEAKIGISNSKSISLFTKVGFIKVCENKIFQEITFKVEVTKPWIKWLKSQTMNYLVEEKNLMT